MEYGKQLFSSSRGDMSTASLLMVTGRMPLLVLVVSRMNSEPKIALRSSIKGKEGVMQRL